MNNTLDLSSGVGESKRVNVDNFSEKYLSVTDIALAKNITKAILSGAKYILVDLSLINELDRKLADQKRTEAILQKTAHLNNIGIEAEKEGRIADAIEAYEENIATGQRALHAYDRLRILYHRAKDYNNEIRVIKRMIEVNDIDPTDESAWWIKQLRKAEALLAKTTHKKSKNKAPVAPTKTPDKPINIFWTD